MEGAMTTNITVMGLFPDEQRAVSTIEAMAGYPWRIDQVHSPFPSHRILDALKVKKSPLGWITLAGGILGFISGFSLAIYTALQWKLIVWGKPIIAWFPFVIVGFEFTILFSVFANVLGLVVLGGLPDYKGLNKYDPRCSGEHFGIVVSCEQEDQEKIVDFFKNQGGEARVFEEQATGS
jgi:molybdopterin-containing oxidoreductase family membrane subunit